jgi:hypothetical protein
VSFAKPEKPAPAPRRRIGREPKCANCGKRLGDHGGFEGKRCPVAPYEFSTVRNYEPARSSVLRSPAEPRCDDCRHQKASHRLLNRIFSDGCDKCGCLHYTPARPRKLTTARASVARKSAPARTKRPRKLRKGKRASIARECDRLWSLIVRSRGRSEISGSTENLQGAHGFSRSYKATRWLPLNGFALTQSEHVYFTYRPLEWDEHLRKSWGQPVYDELRAIALKNEKQDMPAVLAKLKAEAAARGIE